MLMADDIREQGRKADKAHRLHLRSAKNKDVVVEKNWTSFRTSEKRFKARYPPPDVSNVLDLALLDTSRDVEVKSGVWSGCTNSVEWSHIPLSNGKRAYTLPSLPGLVLLPAFLSPEKQKELVRWGLSEQARSPNPTNLDTHYVIPEKGVWNLFIRSKQNDMQESLIQPRASDFAPNLLAESSGPRALIDNIPASKSNFKEIYNADTPEDVPSSTMLPTSSSELIRKLRWANIGWYYHWGSKQYNFKKGKAPISNKIKDLCEAAVAAVDWNQVYSDSDVAEWGEAGAEWKTWGDTYEPDAGIVNFYQTKDTLMAHVDRSEVSATSPLVSISLGNAAVFLIGGQTRDTEPVPILLRSGDIVIMSGPHCRRAYHGVPRILENTLPPHMRDGDRDWDIYKEYLETTRINVNVRQVFPKGFDPRI